MKQGRSASGEALVGTLCAIGQQVGLWRWSVRSRKRATPGRLGGLAATDRLRRHARADGAPRLHLHADSRAARASRTDARPGYQAVRPDAGRRRRARPGPTFVDVGLLLEMVSSTRLGDAKRRPDASALPRRDHRRHDVRGGRPAFGQAADLGRTDRTVAHHHPRAGIGIGRRPGSAGRSVLIRRPTGPSAEASAKVVAEHGLMEGFGVGGRREVTAEPALHVREQ